MAISVKINGKTEQLENDVSITDVLTGKGVRIQMVAVEINGNFIDKSLFDSTILRESDEVEYLYYMGGGMSKYHNERFRT